MPEISDYDSARGALEAVRRLTRQLDVDHPDLGYQASQAGQLARAAHSLARNLRQLDRSDRIRAHLRDHHGLAVTDRDAQACWKWLGTHHAAHAEPMRARYRHVHDDDLLLTREERS